MKKSVKFEIHMKQIRNKSDILSFQENDHILDPWLKVIDINSPISFVLSPLTSFQLESNKGHIYILFYIYV